MVCLLQKLDSVFQNLKGGVLVNFLVEDGQELLL